MPEVPPRLDIIFQKYDPPLYFVTFNTHRRKRLLANAQVHERLAEFGRAGEKRGISVGRYVIMPDHIHLFVSNNSEIDLSQWVRLLKRNLSQAIPISPPHWQKGFFDHLIRNSKSHCEKWEYVYQNPVRAELVTNPDDWPWKGELVLLD
ncbi:MAG TPA: transposase [Chthoniobacterales bacterium]|nr:transposase [Chthoniobacterales bacterium]